MLKVNLVSGFAVQPQGRMLAKSLAFAAIVASASAYAPSMSMGMGRRQVIQTAAAGAVAAPLLRTAPAEAAGPKPLIAPVITILDHRGCEANANHQEYKGKKAGNDNDQMCIVVRQQVIRVPESDAAKLRQEFIGMKETAINVPQISQLGPSFKERD